MTNFDDETFESKAMREALQETLREMANILKACLPEGIGYTLWLYDYGAKGNTVYISTAVREDMIKLVKEWLAKADKDKA